MGHRERVEKTIRALWAGAPEHVIQELIKSELANKKSRALSEKVDREGGLVEETQEGRG